MNRPGHEAETKHDYGNRCQAVSQGPWVIHHGRHDRHHNGDDGKDYGLTANSFNSVSMDPPMVLWSLGKKSSSLPVFAADRTLRGAYSGRRSGKHVNRFAKSGTDKFAGCALARGHGGVPLLDGCSARFECRVVHRYEGGDHVIFVGEVMNFDSFDQPPLAFHGGNYGW